MNEDEMAAAAPLAGEELERALGRYARVRLDPSQAQRRRARSALHITRAAPPEHGITISSIRIGSAIIFDASTSSTVIGWPKNTASGLTQALTR